MKPDRKSQTSAKPKSRIPKSSSDLQEEVRRRAFELYERGGRADGHDIDDWLQAETELVPMKAKKTA